MTRSERRCRAKRVSGGSVARWRGQHSLTITRKLVTARGPRAARAAAYCHSLSLSDFALSNRRMIKRCDSRVSATHRGPCRMRLRTARPPSLAPPHLPLKPPRRAETSRPRVVCRGEAHKALSRTYTVCDRPHRREGVNGL